MPARIPTEIKDSVVQSWLCGLTRRPNARKHGVSEGSVDNCVNGWMVQRGPDGEYDRVRALAIAFSKTGLSVQQCADGHRVAMIMKNMGVAADDYESFISKLWKRHIASGSSPDILIEQINQLYFFLENNQNHLGITTSLSELLEIIKTKIDTIKELESKKQNLEETNQKLFTQKEGVEAELQWDSQLKEKLDKNGLKKEDVSKFVKATLLMKERGYNIFEIIEKFSEFEEIGDACAFIQLKEGEARIRHDQLTNENKALEVGISQNSLKLRELDTLRALGFGHDEFRILRNIITEVGEVIGLIGNDAVKSFFDDLRNYYYDYVRLRESISKLKAEKARLNAGADAIQNMFQNFVSSHSKTDSGSVPKYSSDAQVVEDDKTRKSVMIDGDTVSAKGTTETTLRSMVGENSGILRSDKSRDDDKFPRLQPGAPADSETTNANKGRETETEAELRSAHDHHQGNDIINFMQSFARDDSQVELQLAKRRPLHPPFRIQRMLQAKVAYKGTNDCPDNPGIKNNIESFPRRRSRGSNSVSSGPFCILNAKYHQVSEKTNELLPDMSQIYNSMTETTLGSMFGENSKELNEWKRRAK